MADWLGWLRKAPAPQAAHPPAPPPAPPRAGPDPLGLPDFLSRLRIGDRSGLTDAHFAAAGRRLGLPAAVIKAVVQVECGGQPGFGADGLPLIRYEPHVFSQLTAGAYDAVHPDISYPQMDPRKYPQSQELRWRQLAKAFLLDSESALRATSWGAFQILGMNFAACGFPSAAAFTASVAASEARQLEAFESFIAAHKLAAPLKAKRWKDFASAYNGPRFAESYARQLASAYKAVSKGQA